MTSTPTPHGDPPASAPLPPTLGDLAWVAAIAGVKATIVALAADAFVNSTAPKFRGKAMRVRAIGYTAALLVVPVAWRIRGRHQLYPRELDLLVALPLLADAAGNAAGIYRRAHIDDAIHFANGALLASVAGSLGSSRTRTAWEAAAFAALIGIGAATAWETAEWIGLKLGATGMDLTYDDTMADLIETSLGAMLGGLVTLLRHPTNLRQLPGRRADPIVLRA